MKLGAIPGATVNIRVNGVALQEYDANDGDDSNGRVGSAYVEAPSGADFTVCFDFPVAQSRVFPRHPVSGDVVICRIYLDGKKALSKVHTALTDNGGRITREYRGIDSYKIDRYILERFKFADLPTNDGHANHLKKEDFQNLGEIKVKFILAREITAPTPSYEAHNFTYSNNSIPEKCLKGRAISNHATLGGQETVGVVNTVQVDYPYGERSIGTYVFKYRSRRDLQVEGIIPRSPSPTPLEDRNPEDLSTEEARELVRRMRAREQDQVRVKQEKRSHSESFGEDEDGDDDDVEISEIRNKRRRSARDSGVEVIDLTDD